MIGVWANALAIVLGGLIGTALRGGIREKYSQTINAGLAICVMMIGVSGAIKTSDVLILIVSIVVGSFLGELARIEDGINAAGQWAQRHLAKGTDGFAAGFVSATLVFCVGAMAIVGSMEAGLSNKPDTLLAKAALDGVASVIFASTMGIGVAFSAVPILFYEGGLALLAGVLEPLLTEALVAEISAVGSMLIFAIGLNMLGVTRERIRVGNMVPAVLIPCVYLPAAQLLSKLF